MTKEKSNREKFLELLAKSYLTQVDAAELIAKQTQRPCSPRAVRSWVAESTVPSSRPCPDWAVEALKKAVLVLQGRG